MTEAIILPRPLVVQQPPARCWSAAFESWNDATSKLLGIGLSNISMQTLHDMFDSSQAMIAPSGRARVAGMRAMGAVGAMSLKPLPSRSFSTDWIKRSLANGYLYCAYYWQTGPESFGGHALVTMASTQKASTLWTPTQAVA